MSLSKGVKKLYPILADNDFRSMSPEDLAEVAGYKSVNSVDQVFLRNKDYFTTVGKAGNRLIGIPSKKKKIAIFLRDKLHCVY